MFYTMTHLGSLVHVMEAEITDAYNICIKLTELFLPISCLPVDIALKLRTVHGLIVLVLQDPDHCLDLLPRNIVKLDSWNRSSRIQKISWTH